METAERGSHKGKHADSHRELEETRDSFLEPPEEVLPCPHLDFGLPASSVKSPNIWSFVRTALGN